jgi:hypothetical protein
MLRKRIPHWLAIRIGSAAMLLSVLPLAAFTNPALACVDTLFWSGNNPTQTIEQSLPAYYWKTDATAEITNWDDGNRTSPTAKKLPAGGDATLKFPDWAVNKHATNDMPVAEDGSGYPVYNMFFLDTTGYLVDGNPIQLVSEIDSSMGTNEVSADLQMSASSYIQYIDVGKDATLILSGNVTGPGVIPQGADCYPMLEKVGKGTAELTGEKNVYNGLLKVYEGTLYVTNMTVEDLALTLNATLVAKIQSQTEYTQYIVSDSVTLANASFTISALPQTPGNYTYTLIDNQSAEPVAGTFNNLPEGSELKSPTGQRFTISYVGGDGNDVVLTPIFLPVYMPLINQR